MVQEMKGEEYRETDNERKRKGERERDSSRPISYLVVEVVDVLPFHPLGLVVLLFGADSVVDEVPKHTAHTRNTNKNVTRTLTTYFVLDKYE